MRYRDSGRYYLAINPDTHAHTLTITRDKGRVWNNRRVMVEITVNLPIFRTGLLAKQ